METPGRTHEPHHDEHRNHGAEGLVAQQQDDDDQLGDPPDADASALAPLCGEAEFAGLVAELVADEAPRLFAVVQEYGERVDGRIAAWGMALEDRAEIVRVEGGSAMSLCSPDRATRIFTHHPDITARLVWVHPDESTPPEWESASRSSTST